MRTVIFCVLALVLSLTARGQIAAGEALPTLDLTTSDGAALRVLVEGGELTFQKGGAIERPKALMVHFLQTDCPQCQAQLKAMQAIYGAVSSKGGLIVGAAHRGDVEAVRTLQAKLGLTFPIGVLASKAGLEKKVAGDACAIVDRTGVVRFAQAGFGEGDQAVWSDVFDALLAGRPSPRDGVARERLKAGDAFPAVRLPSLRTGRPMEFAGVDGKLFFTDEDGETTHPKAAIFFFSRY
jgi:peroxiredoxin